MEGKTKLNNRLWQARHKIGLEQKQAARLLGHKTTDQISRYERGVRLPGFQTACKLAIIYGTSLNELFPEHYKQYRREIETTAEAFAASLKMKVEEERVNENSLQEIPHDEFSTKESTEDAPLCHYARLLDNSLPNQAQLNAVRRHITKLVRALTHL